MTRYPLYRRLRWPQRRSGQVRKISPIPGFDPRIVQPVASLYTDYATTKLLFTEGQTGEVWYLPTEVTLFQKSGNVKKKKNENTSVVLAFNRFQAILSSVNDWKCPSCAVLLTQFGQFLWPCGLKRWSAAVLLLESRVRIPLTV